MRQSIRDEKSPNKNQNKSKKGKFRGANKPTQA